MKSKIRINIIASSKAITLRLRPKRKPIDVPVNPLLV